MEKIIEFLTLNYIWVIVALVFIVFTVIGYFVDRRQIKKNKLKKQAQEQAKIEKEVSTTEVAQPIMEETPIVESKKETKEFYGEENFDLSSLVNSEEPVTSEEPKVEVEETPIETQTDRNLEYLLNQQEKDEQEVESIDDFLQRTMREAYQPTVITEEEPAIEQTKVEEPVVEETKDLDYEDTLPIPIQQEDFTPLEVTVVDPEFYKEQKEETVKNEYDFKKMEERILDSLDKINLDNN